MGVWTENSSSRREFLATSGLALAAGSLASPARAAGEPGAAMTELAARFMDGLDDQARAEASFPFDGRTRRAWNFMGARAKPGLLLETMNAAQKTASMELLATALSPHGLHKAEKVMLLQDVLREMGSGPRDRSRERFAIAIFGTPSVDEPWGWRFEGHHLSLSFTLIGNEVVSVTPSSFSSNPNLVASGPHRGTLALDEEERLARLLYRDLSAANRDRALIRERAFGNILTTAGREDRLGGTPEGVAFADLHSAQRDLAMRLIDTYGVDHLNAALAEQQRTRLREGDVMAARLAWAGSNREGEMMYYRLHGETFLIEFASLRNQPLHLHTIRHDLERNLGAHRLA